MTLIKLGNVLTETKGSGNGGTDHLAQQKPL